MMNKIKCTDKYRCTSNKCDYCLRNKNARLKDEFKDCGYEPTCANYYTDCVNDPAYQLHCYEKGWVKYCESDVDDLRQKARRTCSCGYGVPFYKSYKEE